VFAIWNSVSGGHQNAARTTCATVTGQKTAHSIGILQDEALGAPREDMTLRYQESILVITMAGVDIRGAWVLGAGSRSTV